MDYILSVLDRIAGAWFNYRVRRKISDLPEYERPKITHAEMNARGAEFIAEFPAVATIAEEAARFLEKNAAENFVQFDFFPRGMLRMVRVTVAWATGEMPAEQNARLRARVADLEEQIIGAQELDDYRKLQARYERLQRDYRKLCARFAEEK